MKVSTWLEEAANYIEENGWVRETFRADDRACLVGALMETGATLDHMTPLRFVAEEIGQESSAMLQMTVALWNDHGAAGAHEVIDVLWWSAKRARDAGDPEAAVQVFDFPADLNAEEV
jgi:hypothetical protein